MTIEGLKMDIEKILRNLRLIARYAETRPDEINSDMSSIKVYADEAIQEIVTSANKILDTMREQEQTFRRYYR